MTVVVTGADFWCRGLETIPAGIWCANVQHYAREDVSDHALALLMGCVRRVTERDRDIRKGLWNSATRLHSFR